MAAAPGAAPPPLVLVADDDAEVRDFVCEVLRGAGFVTETASDGDEVAEQARRAAPRLIILDVMMPRMDGYTTLTRLRGHPATRDIPVIVLTGQAEPVYRTLSAGVGAVAHLTKPFSPEELTRTVRRVIAEAPA
jgi:two-component system, OmpR family, response regulator